MRRLWVACALAVVFVLRAYSIASAHVTLVSSTPVAGSRLDEEPSRIRLEFSETLDASIAKIWLVSRGGTVTPLAVTSDPSNAYALLAAGLSSGPGTYRVVWHVVSDDGHPVSGNFTFIVGAGNDPPPDVPGGLEHAEAWGPVVAGAPLIPAVLRGLGVGALAALAGLFAFSLRAAATPTQQRATMWLAVAAPVLLVGHLFAWLLHTAPDNQLTSEWMSSAFGSSAGRLELWRTILAVPPLWALWLARRPTLAFALTIPGLLLSAAIGHSAAFQPMYSVPLKAIHLLAMAVWLGGLLWLSTLDRADAQGFARGASRVSTFALAGVIAIAASGVAQAFVLLPSFTSLRSSYGAFLIAKLAGLIILVGFGAYHRFRVMPQLVREGNVASAKFVGSLRGEITVMWLVVLLGGLLAYVSPPMPATTEHHHTPSGSNQ